MFFFFNTLKKKKEVPLEARAEDYLTPTMTALFHSPATRGPVMQFCESEARASRTESGSVAFVSSPSHVYLAVQPRAWSALVQCGLYNVLRHGSAPANQRRVLIESVSAERNAPRPIRGVFQESVYTRTHD